MAGAFTKSSRMLSLANKAKISEESEKSGFSQVKDAKKQGVSPATHGVQADQEQAGVPQELWQKS